MKIKKKLLITYILAIIIPVFVTVLLLLLAQLYMSNQTRFNQIEDTDAIINKTIKRIDENLENIDDYDAFNDKVINELNGKNNIIIIVDLENKILFHSDDKQASLNQETYFIEQNQSYSISYIGNNDDLILIKAPLIKDNVVIGYMELSLDRFQTSMSVINELIRFIIFILILGVIVLMILIYLFSHTVSKGVIKPLKALSESAEKIASGDLDEEINYHKNDEFGAFSKVFNAMRIKLKLSLEKQQQLETNRNELISSISHDLRTPITSIKGYVEAILDGKAKDDQHLEQYLGIIQDKTIKLDRLIEDLFQFSQLEYGKLHLNKVVVNSHDLIENIISSFTLDFSLSNISFQVIEPIPTVNIEVDIHAISRVFDNIIQNAKNYVRNHAVIELSCINNSETIEFIIKDNGQGIKEEDLPNIFNRFYRGEKSRSRKYGGIGLGLAICKQLIEDHDGKIWVESVYGEGSAFHFEIPIYHQFS